MVITQEVLAKVITDPTNPGSIALNAWIDRQKLTNRLSIVDTGVTESDVARFNHAGKGGQNGDISIKKYIEANSMEGQILYIISNDSDLIKFTGGNSPSSAAKQGGNWVSCDPYQACVGWVVPRSLRGFTHYTRSHRAHQTTTLTPRCP